jgi:quinol-cytochrome oxidoreductase complex cytochrome b subunit
MAGKVEEAAPNDDQGSLAKVLNWFDSRLGLSYDLLRPAPQYAINPFYWLGALAVIAFVIQGVTGVIMMLFYVPSPVQAFPSTQYIFQQVNYGRFLETVHLYTAYAMIMLAFMHMMRGYFVSVHKKPREMMWVVGMAMGFATLGFGFTGYLLPWTIVSKSATDVGIGMIDALPPPISSFLSFLIVGAGGDATELLRFYDLHVVVLPAILLVLLVAKMYMLEAHGISEPATGSSPIPEKRKRLIPIFPDVSLYLCELAALFGSAMLLISALFPLDLPPQYSPQLAAQYTAQPDWYFLWIYQILKISIFEGAGLPVALSAVTLIFIAFFLLPFIDRGKTRRVSERPMYITLGAIFVAEIAVLAYWGRITPGRVIPNEQATLVLGGTALAVALISLASYKLLFRGLPGRANAAKKVSTLPSIRSASIWTAGSFVLLLGLGTLSIGSSIGTIVELITRGPNLASLESLVLSLAGLSLMITGTVYLLYRLDLGSGTIRRRIRAFEVGWKG